jgi:hypothetical protein
MFKGKEFLGQVGNIGLVSCEVTDQLKVRLALTAEVNLIDELKRLAAKTKTPIDDKAIAWLEKIVRANVADNAGGT